MQTEFDFVADEIAPYLLPTPHVEYAREYLGTWIDSSCEAVCPCNWAEVIFCGDYLYLRPDGLVSSVDQVHGHQGKLVRVGIAMEDCPSGAENVKVQVNGNHWSMS